MSPHYTDPLVTLYLGDCLDVMRELPDASVDSVVTDPPYGLEFMGKSWDRLGDVGTASHQGFDTEGKFKGFKLASYNASANKKCRACGKWAWDYPERKCNCETPDFPSVVNHQSKLMQEWHEAWATEAFRVLKPGGYLLAFGGTRTYHRLASAIEDAGFEIRDSLMHIYASGFPKSKNLGDGRGSALKPAHEPICMARKPLVGTLQANVERYGTGAINIDACRITTEDPWKPSSSEASGPSRTDSTAASAEPRSSHGEPESAIGSVGGRALKPLGGSETSTDTPKPDTGCLPGTTTDGSATSGSTAESGKTPTGRSRRVTSSTTSTKTGSTTDSITSSASPEPSTPESIRLSAPITHDSTATTEPETYATSSAVSESLNDSSPDAPAGRWPSNVLLSSPELFDEPNPWVVGSGATVQGAVSNSGNGQDTGILGKFGGRPLRPGPADSGGYSRFFRVPSRTIEQPSPASRASSKAPEVRSPGEDAAATAPDDASLSSERAGVDYPSAFIIPKADRAERERGLTGVNGARGNSHPTVKALDLMRHLVRLVTPPGGVTLDPFLGSGTTALAASEEGFRCIGIEREAEYLEIAVGRLMATPMGLGLDVPVVGKRRTTKGSNDPNRFDGVPRWQDWKAKMVKDDDEEPAA